MKKQTMSPTVIVVCGILATLLLGTCATFMSETTPIMKLRPALEKVYGVRGFRCSLHLEQGRLDVEPPSGLELDRLGRRRLGAMALRRYVDLTKGKTAVVLCHVMGTPVEAVTADQLGRFETVESLSSELVGQASAAGGAAAKLTIAPGSEGTIVAVDAACDEAGARRITASLAKVPYVSLVIVRRDGRVLAVSGADAKLWGDVASVGTR